MYTQFFGGFLLRRGVVSKEQLMDAMGKTSTSRIKLGTMAMYKGLMTAEEVDECIFLQSREDKRFGEIALERGYLSWEQVEDLLRTQGFDYLLLGQNLVEAGALTNKELESFVLDYYAENGMNELEEAYENHDKVKRLIEKFLLTAKQQVSDYMVMYINLVFNNLVRFIGDDFVPMMPYIVDKYEGYKPICQQFSAVDEYTSIIDCSDKVAIEFASRYAKEQFSEYDEYVAASLEDFLNLHNGLFAVNMSNEFSIECSLEAPYECESNVITDKKVMVFPVEYTFGTINLLASFE